LRGPSAVAELLVVFILCFWCILLWVHVCFCSVRFSVYFYRVMLC